MDIKSLEKEIYASLSIGEDHIVDYNGEKQWEEYVLRGELSRDKWDELNRRDSEFATAYHRAGTRRTYEHCRGRDDIDTISHELRIGERAMGFSFSAPDGEINKERLLASTGCYSSVRLSNSIEDIAEEFANLWSSKLEA